jgi:hypothetical protein
MPERSTVRKAKRARREGKSPSTQAGEFVREEIEHIREGKHGARSTKQAIAIGLSKARRAGVDLPPQRGDEAPAESRQSQTRDYEAGHGATAGRRPSRRRSRATKRALKREARSAGSHRALARQAHAAARRRTRSDRSAAAKKAVRTKGAVGRSAAARKAARTRRRLRVQA